MNTSEKNYSRWVSLWERVEASGSPIPPFQKLVGLYSSSNRFYHTLNHIDHCLDDFEEIKLLPHHSNEVELAIWFHDAIYDTRERDNEEKSALLARKVLKAAKLPKVMIERIEKLILVTKTHLPNDLDEKVLVDIDLAILGTQRIDFEVYDLAIRAEYAWVSDELYKKGRKKVLKGFYDRDRIYSTDYFWFKYEKQAKGNLSRALAAL